MGTEIENIRAAWQYALSHRQWADMARTQKGLAIYFDVNGRFREGCHLFGEAGGVEDAVLSAALRVRQARFCILLDRYEEATGLLENSLPILRAHEQLADVADALNQLSDIRFSEGDYEMARRRSLESMEIAKKIGDRRLKLISLNLLAQSQIALGDYETTQALLDEELTRFSELGHSMEAGTLLNNLGILALCQGNLERAQAQFEKSYHSREQLQDLRGMASSLGNWGIAAHRLGAHAQAQRLFEKSLAIDQEIGYRWGEAVNLQSLGDLAREGGDGETAVTHLRAALQIAVDIEALPVILGIFVSFAEWFWAQGNGEQAWELFAFVRQNPATGTWTHARLDDLLPLWQESQGHRPRRERKESRHSLDEMAAMLLKNPP